MISIYNLNNELNKLLESQTYLSEEELNLKQKLEEYIRKFFLIHDEFARKKSQLESVVFDHDEHREELKNKIDDIALALIDKIKKYEESFTKENLSSFDENQSLEHELHKIGVVILLFQFRQSRNCSKSKKRL
jgi:hypothetical protein